MPTPRQSSEALGPPSSQNNNTLKLKTAPVSTNSNQYLLFNIVLVGH
jgi:hypothetical protein